MALFLTTVRIRATNVLTFDIIHKYSFYSSSNIMGKKKSEKNTKGSAAISNTVSISKYNKNFVIL